MRWPRWPAGSVQEWHEVAQVEGPERIAMEWWRDTRAARAHPRLFPRREQGRHAGLALPRGSLRPRARHPSARAGTCMDCSRERRSCSDFSSAAQACRVVEPIRADASYAELAVTTNFSFLRGASDPEELVERARDLGLTGIGIADRNSVAGVVRALTKIRAFTEEEKEHEKWQRKFLQKWINQIGCWNPTGFRRWHAGYPRLSARSRRLGAAHAAAFARQAPRRKGRLHPRATGSSGSY